MCLEIKESQTVLIADKYIKMRFNRVPILETAEEDIIVYKFYISYCSESVNLVYGAFYNDLYDTSMANPRVEIRCPRYRSSWYEGNPVPDTVEIGAGYHSFVNKNDMLDQYDSQIKIFNQKNDGERQIYYWKCVIPKGTNIIRGVQKLSTNNGFPNIVSERLVILEKIGNERD